MGDAPTHPELLDWLAAESMASGWRLKPLHRMIVLSQTYQRSSAFQPEAAKLDPDNTLLWRCRQRRLEAEVVRDSILAVSGQLNPQMAGPGFYPTLPTRRARGPVATRRGLGQVGRHASKRGAAFTSSPSAAWAFPRSSLLDAPDTTSSCEQRIVSTTGPQALAFLNGAFIHEQARHFAARLVAEAGQTAREPGRPRVCTGPGPASAA